MMERSDAELAKESIDGNVHAFEELVKRHQSSVFNLAFRMTNSLADAEDVTQETFLRAFRKLGKYNGSYSFRNWILTICSNLTKNVFRKRVNRRETEESYLEFRKLVSHSFDGPWDEFEDAMKTLRPDVRAALTLKYVEGCSYEEISKIMKIGISACKMKVKRGRDKLRRILTRNSGN